MKNKRILLLIVFVILFNSIAIAEDSMNQVNNTGDLELMAEGAILIDTQTMEILYGKNIHEKLFPASTTKILTAILAIENGNLDDLVVVDEEVISLTSGSHIALDVGEEMSLENMLYALLVESANDAALAIAKHISGDLNSFYNLMNNKAKELGALNSNFTNPNGLHDDNHYTTAYDLSLIAKYAMENEFFRNIVKNHTYIIPETNLKNEVRYLNSANRLLYSTRKINVDGNLVPIKYDGAIGVKTGYTKIAQSCLVSAVERSGKSFISVILKSDPNNLFIDTHKILNYGFENFDLLNIGFSNKFINNFKVSRGSLGFVSGVTKDGYSCVVHKNNIDKIEEKILMEEPLNAPIKKNQVIGKVQYTLDNRIIGESDIIATMDIDVDPDTYLYNRLLNKWYILVFILLFFIKLVDLNKKRKIKKARRKRMEFYNNHLKNS